MFIFISVAERSSLNAVETFDKEFDRLINAGVMKKRKGDSHSTVSDCKCN
jgi:hypothetical protein